MNEYRRVLADLAAPRLVGSPHHARARELLRAELDRRGYVVLEHQFPVVPPGRLAGPIYAGGALVWASITVALLGASSAHAAAGMLLAALLVGGVVRVARGMGAAAVGVNLIGVRARARVAVWLAAHYDSKGQPLSMATRLLGVGVAVIGALALVLVAAARLTGAEWSRPVELLLAAPALAGGLLLLQNRATNGSPGAVDNASALVTVLAILDRLPGDAPVGVLFPDAEEYGLLGASALARERANLFDGTVVLNLDGIDDDGSTLCVAHRAGPTVDAVATGLGARRRRFLPVVVDGWAFAGVARECATIMRGGWRTAAVVHTARDTADRLTLEGVRAVSAAVAAVLGTVSAVTGGLGAAQR